MISIKRGGVEEQGPPIKNKIKIRPTVFKLWDDTA